MTRFHDLIRTAQEHAPPGYTLNLHPHTLEEVIEALNAAEDRNACDGREWVYVVVTKQLTRDIAARVLALEERLGPLVPEPVLDQCDWHMLQQPIDGDPVWRRCELMAGHGGTHTAGSGLNAVKWVGGTSITDRHDDDVIHPLDYPEEPPPSPESKGS